MTLIDTDRAAELLGYKTSESFLAVLRKSEHLPKPAKTVPSKTGRARYLFSLEQIQRYLIETDAHNNNPAWITADEGAYLCGFKHGRTFMDWQHRPPPVAKQRPMPSQIPGQKLLFDREQVLIAGYRYRREYLQEQPQSIRKPERQKTQQERLIQAFLCRPLINPDWRKYEHPRRRERADR